MDNITNAIEIINEHVHKNVSKVPNEVFKEWVLRIIETTYNIVDILSVGIDGNLSETGAMISTKKILIELHKESVHRNFFEISKALNHSIQEIDKELELDHSGHKHSHKVH